MKRDELIYMDSERVVELIPVNKQEPRRLRYATTSALVGVDDEVPDPKVPERPGRWRWKQTAISGLFEGFKDGPLLKVVWTWEDDDEVERDQLDRMVTRSLGAP